MKPEIDTPEDQIDIDPETGESVGGNLEPEESGRGAAPVEAAEQEEQAEQNETRRHPVVEAREQAVSSIVENARRVRDEEIRRQRELEPEQLEELDRQAGHARADEPKTEEPPKEPDAAEEPVEVPQAAARKHKLRVNGQEQEVDEQEVIKAGIATLQKERAGDHRIAQARAQEQQLREYHEQLNAYRENLAKGLDQDGQPLRPSRNGTVESSGGKAALPDGATALPDLEAVEKAVKESLSALYNSGDVDGAGKRLASTIADIMGRTAIPGSVDEVAAKAAEVIRAEQAQRSEQERQQRFERERREANRIFYEEFRQIHDDEDLFDLTKARVAKLKSDEGHAGKSLPELVREAAKYVAGKYIQPARESTEGREQRSADALNDRRRLKGKTPLPPSGSQSVRHQPPPEAQPPSNSDYVRRLKEARQPDRARA